MYGPYCKDETHRYAYQCSRCNEYQCWDCDASKHEGTEVKTVGGRYCPHDLCQREMKIEHGLLVLVEKSEHARLRSLDRGAGTIGQYTDDTWYWLDETWNYGDTVRYATYAEAAEAQLRYCHYELDGCSGSDCKYCRDGVGVDPRRHKP